jgi:hypothetical protein
MKKLLLVGVLAGLLVGLGMGGRNACAEDYYDLEHYQIVPDTTTNTNDIRFRGDFKLYDSTHIADFDSLTPKVIFYASGTVVCPRIETEEFVAITTGTFMDVGDKLGFDGDFESDDYIWADSNDRLKLYTGGFPRFTAFSQGVTIESTGKLFLDGGSDTYIYESAADRISLYGGGVLMYTAYGDLGTPQNYFPEEVAIAAGKKLYLDGGGDTYIYESASDKLDFYVNGVDILFLEAGVSTFRNQTLWSFESGTNVSIGSGNKLFLDGDPSGGNTYIYEQANDQIAFVCGNNTMLEIISPDTFKFKAGSKLYLDGGGDTYVYEVGADNIEFVAGGTSMMQVTNGNVQCKDFLPWASNTYDLGAAGTYWADVHYKTLIAHSLVEAEQTETTAKDLLYNISIEDKSSYPSDVYTPAPIATEDIYATVHSTISATYQYEETQYEIEGDTTSAIIANIGDDYDVEESTSTEVLKWSEGEKMGTDGTDLNQLVVYLIEAAKEFKIGDDASLDQAQIVVDLSGLVVECFELLDTYALEMSSMSDIIDQYELEIASNTSRIEMLEQQ